MMFRLLLPLLLAVPLAAQEQILREVFDPVSDTHVEVLALFSKPPPTGYLPVRVKVANNLKKDRDIRLDFNAGSYYSGHSASASRFDIATPAGKTVTRDLMVPLCSYSTQHCRVSLDGDLGSANTLITSNWDDSQPAVLLSEPLYTPNASILDSAASSSSTRGSHEFSSKFDPKQLPDDWRAFAGFDSILMTDHDWSNVPPGSRNAILAWLNLGGQLVIYQVTGGTIAGLPDDPGFGSIVKRPLAADLRMDATGTLKLVGGALTQQSSIYNDFRSHWPLQDAFGAKQFHYAVFVFVMILFAVLVGPVNLFVFAKAGQRHKLFITTPLISLGASLIMIALIIFQDGFGGSGIRRVLMEVRPDAGANAAYVRQEQFSRTGVLGNSRFTIDTPLLMRPVPIHENRWARYTVRSGMKGNFHLQPADGKTEVSGDWWQSRSEQGQIIEAVVPTRGRIERAGSEWVSTFEHSIEVLFYLDENRQWHRGEKINTGKKFELVTVDDSMARQELEQAAKGFAKRNDFHLRAALNRPGHFVALTSKAPAIETNPSIRWKETRTVITGPVM